MCTCVFTKWTLHKKNWLFANENKTLTHTHTATNKPNTHTYNTKKVVSRLNASKNFQTQFDYCCFKWFSVLLFFLNLLFLFFGFVVVASISLFLLFSYFILLYTLLPSSIPLFCVSHFSFCMIFLFNFFFFIIIFISLCHPWATWVIGASVSISGYCCGHTSWGLFC